MQVTTGTLQKLHLYFNVKTYKNNRPVYTLYNCKNQLGTRPAQRCSTKHLIINPQEYTEIRTTNKISHKPHLSSIMKYRLNQFLIIYKGFNGKKNTPRNIKFLLVQ